jgi:enamine deaminase RidA (YjgF/YER057c/UK114 family)
MAGGGGILRAIAGAGADSGIGVRSAVGMGSLPGNIPVEIEAIFELA